MTDGSTTNDYIREEIHTQVAILGQLVERLREGQGRFTFLEDQTFDEVWLVGSGDSHCAALFGANLLNQLGVNARAFRPMDLSYFHDYHAQNPLVVAISVSGKTNRVLEVVRKVRKHYKEPLVVGLTDNPHGPLFEEATHPVLVGASPSELLLRSDYADEVAKEYTGYHHDVAQTKTFFANLLAVVELTWEVVNRPRPVLALLETIHQRYGEWVGQAENWVVANPINHPNKTMFVGSGLFYSLAQFGQYKWFEFTLPGHKQDLEEYAHTHYFVTDPQTSVVFFAVEGAHLRRVEELVAGALQHLIKPELLLLCARPPTIHSTPLVRELVSPSLPPDLYTAWREVGHYLYLLPVIEWLAYHTAKAVGCDTNKFRGGLDVERYVRGSYYTIRQSKVDVD